jgi:transcriptional regulator with XRE-family HTH domain
MPGLVKCIYRPEYRVMLARLRQARKGAGLGQKAVAVRFRRPQSFVSKCESGERRIDPIELLDFARLYGRPVGFFLGYGEQEDGDARTCERLSRSTPTGRAQGP